VIQRIFSLIHICHKNVPTHQVMYDKRSKLGLVGSSFDTSRSDWSSRETTIGPGIDSYYEYLLKVRPNMTGSYSISSLMPQRFLTICRHI